MRRLGLAWRVALIVIAALVAIQLAAAAAYFVHRGQATEAGFRLPLPDQAAALVQLIERAPPDQRALALRAINGAGLRASVQAQRPEPAEQDRRIPWLERAIGQYLGDAAGRELYAYRIPVEAGRAFALFRRGPLRMEVSLTSGGFLVIETADELTARVIGLPPGFWAGIAGFLVAALALLMVVRETRPLARLARSVERFGASPEPVPLPEHGAAEVRALIAAFNRMQSRLAMLLKSRTFMLGAITHDLRTYLTRLRLRVEMMPDAEMRARAASDVEGMQMLIEDSLAFANATFVGAGTDAVDLVALVRRECAERTPAEKVLAGAMPPQAVVRGAAPALARAVGNLLDNALRYGGQAEIAITADARTADIVVEDRGPGVPAAERERIFEPFLRLEASRNRDRGGAGLGLAIVKQVIESHGGTVAVADRPGGGASFRVTLPLAAAG
jgi:two-component system, OmpR family, osmolarity sensor histidine kinase EnvZ